MVSLFVIIIHRTNNQTGFSEIFQNGLITLKPVTYVQFYFALLWLSV